MNKTYRDVTDALSSLRKDDVIGNIGTSRLPTYRMKAHGHE